MEDKFRKAQQEITEMKGEVIASTHRMGKKTGYELVDGEYHIAPLYAQQFEALRERRAGIEDTLAIIARHMAKDLAEIRRQESRIWDDLAEDLGIDRTAAWSYQDGVLRKETSKIIVGVPPVD